MSNQNVESLWCEPTAVLKQLLSYCYSDHSHGFGPHITRYGYYSQIREFVSKNLSNFSPQNVLDISSSLPLLDLFGLDSNRLNISKANYPEYCLPSTGLPSSSYDLILCDQVLEHVEGSPWLVGDELRRLLAPGGVAVLTTVFMMPLHPSPSDFLRYSSEALKHIFVNHEVAASATGSWGNRAVWMLSELGFRWSPVPNNPSNPVNRIARSTEPGSEIATWIVFQKKSL